MYIVRIEVEDVLCVHCDAYPHAVGSLSTYIVAKHPISNSWKYQVKHVKSCVRLMCVLYMVLNNT